MILTINRQKSESLNKPNSCILMCNKLNRKMGLVVLEIDQLRSIFEKAYFILTRRDFDRLKTLESARTHLKTKIELFNTKLSAQLWEPYGARKNYFKLILANLEVELSVLQEELSNLKKEKYAKKGYVDCL